MGGGTRLGWQALGVPRPPEACRPDCIETCASCVFFRSPRRKGIRCASISIDDFYLTYEEQNRVAEANPGNSLLQLRGNAGSHDLALGEETLRRLKGLTKPGDKAQVPRYNKSAYGGRGDRAPEETWPVVEGPLDVVLLEGWMLGFRPTDAERAREVSPELVPVNERLREYHGRWDAYVDSWMVIQVSDPQWVFDWRLQAEQKMRAAGKAGMTDAQIADFVNRFMPAYRLYLGDLYREGPTTARDGHLLRIAVDSTRSPVKLH